MKTTFTTVNISPFHPLPCVQPLVQDPTAPLAPLPPFEGEIEDVPNPYDPVAVLLDLPDHYDGRVNLNLASEVTRRATPGGIMCVIAIGLYINLIIIIN